MTFTICKHAHRNEAYLTNINKWLHSKIPKSPQEIMEYNAEKKFDSNLIPELVSDEILEEWTTNNYNIL